MKHLFSLYILLISGFVNAHPNRPLPPNGSWDLPPVANENLIPVTINYDMYSNIVSNRSWQQINLMNDLRMSLRNNGLPSNLLENYRVRTITVIAKSKNGNGSIRLCQNLNSYSCNQQVVSQYTLKGTPRTFDNPNVWSSYPLFVGASFEAISFPLEVEVIGTVKLNSITIILEPYYNAYPPAGHLPAHPPHAGHLPNPPPNNNLPSFLWGKMVMVNSGVVRIGEVKHLEKNLANNITTLTFANQNTLFKNYNWINLSSIKNSSVVNRITVKCLDHRGYENTFAARDSRGNLINDVYINKTETLIFPVDRDCAFIESIKVQGYSPNAVGSRARISIDLN